jgi:hypothetical protein
MPPDNTITKMILKLILQAFLVLVPVVIISLDAEILIQGSSEFSITEIAQELFILCSAVLFAFCAKLDVNSRGFFVLVAGLFATMFVRESDALLDNIQPGFWLYPALIVSLSSILYARKCAGTVKKPMLEHMESRHFIHISLGLILVMVFSRTFGSGHLWRDIMEHNYSIVYKSVVQEGIELLGYIFVLYGSILVWLDTIKKTRRGK